MMRYGDLQSILDKNPERKRPEAYSLVNGNNKAFAPQRQRHTLWDTFSAYPARRGYNYSKARATPIWS